MADIITISSGIECGLTDKHLIRPLRNVIINKCHLALVYLNVNRTLIY